MSETEVASERHPFCPSCGTKAVGAGSFCSECGGSLIKTPVPPAPGVLIDTQPANIPTVTHSEVSADVALGPKRRRWLWPVGVAVVLLVAAGITFGVSSGNRGSATTHGESAAAALGNKLRQQNVDSAIAEGTCSTRASEQNSATFVLFENECLNAYSGVSNSGSTGASGNATGASGNTGTTPTTPTTPTTRPRAGQVGQGTTNAPCSPCGSDVQPYSGNSGGGAGDVQPYSGNS